MKRLIKKLINSVGYEIRAASAPSPDMSTMAAALSRLKALGFEPQVIIDVGAAEGGWTQLALNTWPLSSYELIEPLEERQATLKALQFRFHDAIRIHSGVAGEKEGVVNFSVSDDLDGSGVYGGGNIRPIPVVTIDSICTAGKGPFMIKLDTHGYEMPILHGAQETLRETDVLIIEVYGFFVSPTALLFNQLSNRLADNGFRLFDVVDVMRRKRDGAFWQADAVYIRADHPTFADNVFH